MVEKALAVGDGADLVELRIDGAGRFDVSAFIERVDRPLLFTNRASWEGGRAGGSEDERIAPLGVAARAGAWVDIELSSPQKSRELVISAAAEVDATRAIISWHDFNATPDRDFLQDILARQMATGADIGKVVTMATGPADVLRVLSLLPIAAEAGFPLCAFCMGEAGRISRVATLGLGGFMTYVSAGEEEATAPGQLTLAAMRTISEAIR